MQGVTVDGLLLTYEESCWRIRAAGALTAGCHPSRMT